MNGAVIVLIIILIIVAIVVVTSATGTPLFSSWSSLGFMKTVPVSETNASHSHPPPSMTVVKDKHGAKSLLLSCIDYRFITASVEYLNKENEGDFDQFVLAGAPLGYNESIEAHSTKEIPKHASNNWHETFEDHVRLAMQLHYISEIIVISHMDCGYFKSIYGEEVDTPEKERKKQIFNLHKFVRHMQGKKEFKDLAYILLLAELQPNGKVTFEEIKN